VRSNTKLLLIVILISLTLVACSGGGDDSNNTVTDNATAIIVPTVPPGAEPSLPINGEGVQLAAKVNDDEITMHEFQRALSRTSHLGDIASYDAIASVELNKLIYQSLINKLAIDWGIVITDEEVESEYQAMREFVQDDVEWQAWLDENVYTEEEFRQSLRDNLITQRIQEMVIDYTAIEQVMLIHARHILVATEEQANIVLARLDAGESFGALSAELSLDPTTRSNDGDLGWFASDDLPHVPELTDLAGQLQPGQRGGPLRTILGYHIVETLEISSRPATEEEKAAAKARQFNNWLQSLREGAIIERYSN
jgi:parvulin-like peptidyl-prolyl isomerase